MVSPADEVLNESLSAVMDGRATPADWARVKAAWAADAGLRERWALWHAAGDGLRSAELPTLHRAPEELLNSLHAQLPAAPAPPARGRDWLAPLAVAASFVAVAVGVGALRPPQQLPQVAVAAAPVVAAPVQGLAGLSFAQTATGRTLPGDAPPELMDWGLPLPEQPASRPRP